ncbi:MAG: FAD:protein FMN transferase [Oscillospiraceae bacterium]|nr:FAD:protein FMN transferase [Oscillospiraceae bacterium]
MVSAVVFSAAMLTGCADKQQDDRISDTRLLLDTYCTIVIHGDVSSELLDEAFALCAELEALFSITIEGSDVWRINHAEGEPAKVDSRTRDVIKAGLEFGELSDGMFDITIGRLTRLWDFGRHRQGDGSSGPTSEDSRTVPLSSDIEDAKNAGNIKDLLISEETVWVREPDGGGDTAWIDLGAIAKGYIADEIAAFLVESGVTGALIDLGGDVVTVGNRPDGSPWRIALRKPFGSTDEWIGIVDASDFAVVSSGTYERSFEKDGVFYHHILDPFTGMPAETDIVSATVIAESAVIGEGLSTIAVLAGSERASEYFEQVSGFICAVLVLDDGEILVIGDMRMLTIGDMG